MTFVCNAGAQERRTVVESLKDIHYDFGGVIGDRIDANVDNWLIRMPKDNPGLLEMFNQRDSTPPLHLVAWSGVFVGNHLVAGALALQMSKSTELKQSLQAVVDELIDLQAEDGYLGPYPEGQRLVGHCYWDTDGNQSHWDLWGHYNIMYGLLLWNETTGDERALQATIKAANLICETFLEGEHEVADANFYNMNGAISHALVLLYHKTGNERYLELTKDILKDYRIAGDYVEKALEGMEYYEMRPKSPWNKGGSRWESLHILQAIAEYYILTGEQKYREAYLHIWQSINRTDIHNTGAFSTNEMAVGNPYEEGPIETCCTVGWMHMSIDALRLSGDPKIADAMEHALLNAMAASQHPAGDWWTYDTPMDGRKYPSNVMINFQTRDDTPELNCCSVNAPRSLGCLGEWAVMAADDTVMVNYYGPMTSILRLDSGKEIQITMETKYPVEGEVKLYVEGVNDEHSFHLRIPGWTSSASLKINAQTPIRVTPGEYFRLTRTWNDADTIILNFDMSLRYVEGADRLKDHVSIYKGPLLLAMDPRFNPTITDEFHPQKWKLPWTETMPLITESMIEKAKILPQSSRNYGAGMYRPWLLMKLPVEENRHIILCDFASAGFPGTSYRSWLPLKTNE